MREETSQVKETRAASHETVRGDQGVGRVTDSHLNRKGIWTRTGTTFSSSANHHNAAGSVYLMNQPNTMSTATTMMIVASNPSPALFFPILNDMPYYAPRRLSAFG